MGSNLLLRETPVFACSTQALEKERAIESQRRAHVDTPLSGS